MQGRWLRQGVDSARIHYIGELKCEVFVHCGNYFYWGVCDPLPVCIVLLEIIEVDAPRTVYGADSWFDDSPYY